MIKIKTPKYYINEYDILQDSGKYILKFANNVLIVGGKTSLSATKGALLESLKSEKIKYHVEYFHGYCSFENIDKFAEIAKQLKVNGIIGVGGGTVMDIVKAVGEKINIHVITVPTIAATCASWSALSVIYDDDGKHKDFYILKNSPIIVLADTRIILEAPKRYLNAGIGDTIVKWYEYIPYLSKNYNDITLNIGLQISKLALNILEDYIENLNTPDIKELRYKDVIDSIFMLAGLVGSIGSEKSRVAIGHTIHNSLTHIKDTRETLHGEKVIFGLLVQFILEKRNKEEVKKIINYLKLLNLPITLGQLGIKENVDSKISSIVNGVKFDSEKIDGLNFKIDKDSIREAIIKVDELGRASLENV